MRQLSHWFPGSVFYQIYLPSFIDGNGDGRGDLVGLRDRLSHVSDLGAEGIIISSFYPSSGQDTGYAPTDHLNIDPTYGLSSDFDGVVQAARGHNLKVFIDLIANHTSNSHPWFLGALKGRHHPSRDWYYFRDPKPDGSPPNNWGSSFGGSAWTMDESSGQYYLHTFFPDQPDLNWYNPQVREAMRATVRYWLARGVDGFRVDAWPHVLKDIRLSDDPPNPKWKEGQDPYERLLPLNSAGHRRMGTLGVEWLKEVFGSSSEVPLILEAYVTPSDLELYHKQNPSTLWEPTDFRFWREDWKLDPYLMRHFPLYALGNQDQPRIASRVGEDRSRALALLQFTLPSTPLIYYGEELGLTNANYPLTDQKDTVLYRFPQGGRDGGRAPLPWTDESGSGFSKTAPWLSIPSEYLTLNVATQKADENSALNFYKRMLRLRKQRSPLRYGQLKMISHPTLLAYRRELGDEKIGIAINFTDKEQAFKLWPNGRSLLSTQTALDGDETITKLAPNEGVVLAI